MQRYRIFDRDNVQVAEYELDDSMAPALLAGFRAELVGAPPSAPAEAEAPPPTELQAQQEPAAVPAPQPAEQVVAVREGEPVPNPQQ